MYQFKSAPNFRLLSGLNLAQSAWWAGVYGLSFLQPEVPLWWGAAGLTMGLALGFAIRVRAQRVVQEVAVYESGHLFRIQSATSFGKPLFRVRRV